MRRSVAAALIGVAAVGAVLPGCGQAPTLAPARAPALTLTQPVVLLGEVHDNAAQHALRLQAFRDLLTRGARPALALEQIDRSRQAALDALRARTPPPDADAVVAAVGEGGWNWAFYKPFIALALEHGLPIVAANVSRDEVRQVMREGLAATGFDPAVPEALLAGHARDIEDTHCGAIDAATARRMALAQVARDQFMARVLREHAARGVVLLAGNGHVRTDVGAPRWLDEATRARSEAIGLLEPDKTSGRYDRVVVTVAQERPDPCAALRGRSRGPG